MGNLIDIVLESVSPDCQFVVTSKLFDKLNSEPDESLKTVLVNVLKALISSKKGLMGLTMPELLETFVSQLANCSRSPDISVGESLLKESLVGAITALALHPDYPNQLNDVLRMLIAKLENLHDNDDGITRFNVFILDALTNIMQAKSERNLSLGRNLKSGSESIAYEVFAPILHFSEKSSSGWFF